MGHDTWDKMMGVLFIERNNTGRRGVGLGEAMSLVWNMLSLENI